MRVTCLLAATLLGLWLSSPPAGAAEGRAADPRPNIILILCDDMGWSDIGPYGGEVETPHLDRLAEQGLKFTQFYNNAKCTTTRASVITGLYPRKRGGLLSRRMLTLGEALRRAGYRTALSGKWHLGSGSDTHPHRRGFEEYYGLLDGCCNFFDPSIRDPKFKGARIRKFARNETPIREFPSDYYTTDAFTDHAIECLRKFNAAGPEPYFLHICYTAPHYPLHAPEEIVRKYLGRYRDGWEQLRAQRHARQIKMGLIDPQWEAPPLDPKARDWDEVPADQRDWYDRRMAVYAAMIDRMDWNIGRLLEALDESGEADNTLVLFLSDNGGCSEQYPGDKPEIVPGLKEHYTTCGPSWAWAQNTPFRRYKTWMHEGGIATPMIARWPRIIEAKTTTDQVGHIIDFMPTFLELAESSYPETYGGQEVLPAEGKSLAPIFRGETRAGHERLFWEFTGNRAVREGNWKLCWDKTVRRWELYDLAVDRTEMRDLAEKHPQRVEALANQWEGWDRRMRGK